MSSTQIDLAGEVREVAVTLINWHLPEARGEVNCVENGVVFPTNVAHAFIDFFHEILVRVGLFVDTLDIVDDSLFVNAEDGGVVGRFCLSRHPQFQPFL